LSPRITRAITVMSWTFHREIVVLVWKDRIFTLVPSISVIASSYFIICGSDTNTKIYLLAFWDTHRLFSKVVEINFEPFLLWIFFAISNFKFSLTVFLVIDEPFDLILHILLSPVSINAKSMKFDISFRDEYDGIPRTAFHVKVVC